MRCNHHLFKTVEELRLQLGSLHLHAHLCTNHFLNSVLLILTLHLRPSAKPKRSRALNGIAHNHYHKICEIVFTVHDYKMIKNSHSSCKTFQSQIMVLR